MSEKRIIIRHESDIIRARREGRCLAKKLGFGLADQTRLATAISELTRNVLTYAGEGVCILSVIPDKNKSSIKIVVEDRGPGIPDIEKAMKFGYSTNRGMGAGLPGTKKIVHRFDIDSGPEGTRVTIAMIRQKTLSFQT